MVEVKDILEMVNDIVEEEVKEITENTKFKDIPLWDSFYAINLAVAVKKKYGKKMSPTDYVKIQTVGELIAFIKA